MTEGGGDKDTQTREGPNNITTKVIGNEKKRCVNTKLLPTWISTMKRTQGTPKGDRNDDPNKTTRNQYDKGRETEQGFSLDRARQKEEKGDPTATMRKPLEGGLKSPEQADLWTEAVHCNTAS